VPAIRSAIATLPAAAAAPPAPKPAAPNSIRPTGASPASAPMQKEPGSVAEAINMSLDRGY
jgi:hypothetical protein